MLMGAQSGMKVSCRLQSYSDLIWSLHEIVVIGIY